MSTTCMTFSKGQFGQMKAAILPHASTDKTRPLLTMLRIRTFGDGTWSIDATDSYSLIRANGASHDPDLGATDQSGVVRFPTDQELDFLVLAADFFSLRPQASVRVTAPALEDKVLAAYISDGKTTVRLFALDSRAEAAMAEEEKARDITPRAVYPDLDAIAGASNVGWPVVNAFAINGAHILSRFAKVKAPVYLAHVGRPNPDGFSPLAFFFRGYLTTYRGLVHVSSEGDIAGGNTRQRGFFEDDGARWLRVGEDDPLAPAAAFTDEDDEG